MEQQAEYSDRGLKNAKDSISHAVGYKDKGLEAYAAGFRIDSFEDFRGKRVLDLGAGAHLQFARGLEKAGIEAEVVSFSPAFTDAKWRHGIEGRKESDMIAAGMGEHLPFPDASFDRVVSLDVPEHLETYDTYILYLKEIGRVLAPGGVAYIGPTMEFHGTRSADAVPKEELEKILDEIDVSYHSSHDIHKFLTLTLRKRAHA